MGCSHRAERRCHVGLELSRKLSYSTGMPLVDIIREDWSWSGLRPVEVSATNEFGHLVVEDESGHYWLISPEKLTCEVIADDLSSLERVLANEQFIRDWRMDEEVILAQRCLGPRPPGKCYHLKQPARLGGRYAEGNLTLCTLESMISLAGSIAEQVKDLPAGTPIRIIVKPGG
jgi:hypothetical protein